MSDTAPTPSADSERYPYLAGLNTAQRQAVAHLDGPLLVLAGAGTGKTRVLTTRLAHLLATGKARPGDILAVTFTNKAAREMRQRVGGMLGRDVEGWWLGTFHALATRILRRHAELVGLSSNFTILDSDDQQRLLKQVLSAHDVDTKRWPARYLLHVIQRWKDKGLAPEALRPADAGDIAGGNAIAIYQAYQERLRSLNACDFGDLLLHTLTIFQQQPEILTRWQQRFRYILVDEYQDTNVAQYLWLRLLAQQHKNICCVGDDDQSIYAFRGAEVGNILRFEQDFPGATVVRLEENYRSTAHILGAADGLIAHNQGRMGKTLVTTGETGAKVTVRQLWDGREEARHIAEAIEQARREGTRASDMAVLVRTSGQMRAFEERFLTVGLPYRVVGGPRFYERQECRDALAYLRVVHQPDDDLAFERILNRPKRGIGEKSLQTLQRVRREAGRSLTEASAQAAATDELPKKARKALTQLLDDLQRWRNQLATMHHAELAKLVLEESGYTQMWQNDRSPEAEGRLETLNEFVAGMESFDSLAGFLEHVALVMEATEDPSEDQVVLMTLHGAKGLEFDLVFLPGWEEGLFPHQRAIDENGVAGLEEERRLAYVGLTRARRRAEITHVAERWLYNQMVSCLPSRFVQELPEGHVTTVTEAAVATAQPTAAAAQSGGSRFPFAGQASAAAGGGSPGRVIDAAADLSPARSRPSEPLQVGERVYHDKFGYGVITDVEDDKAQVHFEHAGTKRVLDSFLKRPAH